MIAQILQNASISYHVSNKKKQQTIGGRDGVYYASAYSNGNNTITSLKLSSHYIDLTGS